jgi:hypothetical protein
MRCQSILPWLVVLHDAILAHRETVSTLWSGVRSSRGASALSADAHLRGSDRKTLRVQEKQSTFQAANRGHEAVHLKEIGAFRSSGARHLFGIQTISLPVDRLSDFLIKAVAFSVVRSQLG